MKKIEPDGKKNANMQRGRGGEMEEAEGRESVYECVCVCVGGGWKGFQRGKVIKW